jgi:hypothetical protein
MTGPKTSGGPAPAGKVAEYALAGSIGVGQARRWSTLSRLSRLKQSKFTI